MIDSPSEEQVGLHSLTLKVVDTYTSAEKTLTITVNVTSSIDPSAAEGASSSATGVPGPVTSSKCDPSHLYLEPMLAEVTLPIEPVSMTIDSAPISYTLPTFMIESRSDLDDDLNSICGPVGYELLVLNATESPIEQTFATMSLKSGELKINILNENQAGHYNLQLVGSIANNPTVSERIPLLDLIIIASDET